MLKRFSLMFIIAVLVLTIGGPVIASEQGQADPESGGMGGVVLPYGQGITSSAITNLSYHGGPVMRTNKTYAIYWIPAGFAVAHGYPARINQFLTDVAAADGSTTNTYYSDTQYYGPGGTHITTISTFGGYYMDTHAFPANGCALASGLIKCLSDAQLRTEIARVIKLKGWVVNSTSMFFIFTPDKVRSCFGSSCSFTHYCAYHSYFGSVIYANQPYAYAKPAACGIGYATSSPPNGFAADSTINVTSHEHNEAITDPKLNAWWDSTTGDENADKCAWTFGTVVSGHNQLINGHYYILQRNWSNATKRCVLSGY